MDIKLLIKAHTSARDKVGRLEDVIVACERLLDDVPDLQYEVGKEGLLWSDMMAIYQQSKQIEEAKSDRLWSSIVKLQKICRHTWVDDGNDSHYHWRKCTLCNYRDTYCPTHNFLPDEGWTIDKPKKDEKGEVSS